MSYQAFTPLWFINYGISLELAFAITTLIVSYYAYIIFKLTDQWQIRLFSLGFFSISLSYFIKSYVNFSAINQGNSIVIYIWLYTYLALFLVGLINLAYMALNTKSFKTYALISSLSMTALVFSENPIIVFYLISSIYLLFISHYYYHNYQRHKTKNTFIVLLAFIFLMLGNIQFIFSIDNPFFYVLGHSLELIAYILILSNLIMMINKNEKRKTSSNI